MAGGFFGWQGPAGPGGGSGSLPTGTDGQFVGYGAGGVVVAVDAPDGSANLPAGTDGQFVGYGAGGAVIAVDAPSGGGADGADGDSAYEVAVSNGFVGTEAEWLASLVGADGADGTDGTVLPAGTDGQLVGYGAGGAIEAVTRQNNAIVTQAEYDALSPPDPAVTYLIVE